MASQVQSGQVMAVEAEGGQLAPFNSTERALAMALQKKSQSGDEKIITLIPIERSHLLVKIQGTSELVPHRFSEKAKQMIADKQGAPATHSTKAKREPKNPEQEADAATYWLEPGRPGMPAAAFKSALVSACRSFGSITMKAAKQIFFVRGEGPEELVEIQGAWRMREDHVRNANGVADLRYRNGFPSWSAELHIEFNPKAITKESIVALIQEAGQSVGVGDWRPSAPNCHSGTKGCWAIASEFLAGSPGKGE